MLALGLHKALLTNPAKAFEDTLLHVQDGLTKTTINHMTSGSTFVGAFLMDNELYVANVGDSRAVIGRAGNNDSWTPFALSSDHKPSVPTERDRIIASGGFVKESRGQAPARVYLDPELTVIGICFYSFLTMQHGLTVYINVYKCMCRSGHVSQSR